MPNCPECGANLTYSDQDHFVCPHCGHEWTAEKVSAKNEDHTVIGANGDIDCKVDGIGAKGLKSELVKKS